MLCKKYAYQCHPSPACLYGLRSCKRIFILLTGGSARSTEVFRGERLVGAFWTYLAHSCATTWTQETGLKGAEEEMPVGPWHATPLGQLHQVQATLSNITQHAWLR